ncbi:MAG: glycine cleavage T C-terminal barrel domain-containing protein [Hyphomicrobiales bacterium]
MAEIRTGAPYTSFATRVRKSPFFGATERWGCKGYSVYNHMWMPLWYESPEADFWALVTNCALWDVSVQRQVEITGPDAARFTQLLTPRNLSKCAVNQCKYVLITDENGGCINDPVLLRLGENHFWLSLADSDILLWAKGLAYNSGMNVSICEPDVSPLQLQGPKSVNVMEDLFGKGIWDLKYYWNFETELDGIPLVISRTGWSSERGYELYLRDGSRGDELWERVMEAGKPHGIAPGTPSTIRRIEGGIISYAADFGAEDTPFHIGLERLVDLEMDADFVGKDALRTIAETGIDRKLIGVEIEGDALPGVNGEWWPAKADGAPVGELRSAVYSPRLEKNIGFAMVKSPHWETGSRIEIETEIGPRAAEVVALPFTPRTATK